MNLNISQLLASRPVMNTVFESQDILPDLSMKLSFLLDDLNDTFSKYQAQHQKILMQHGTMIKFDAKRPNLVPVTEKPGFVWDITSDEARAEAEKAYGILISTEIDLDWVETPVSELGKTKIKPVDMKLLQPFFFDPARRAKDQAKLAKEKSVAAAKRAATGPLPPANEPKETMADNILDLPSAK